MKGRRKTIGHGMMVVGIAFTAVLCLLMAIQTTMMLKGSMYRRYDAHIKDVLTYLDHTIDKDDLQQCIKAGEPSEKYNMLQQRLNKMVDEFELLYIYISIPTRTETGEGIMVNVVSSTSDAERAEGMEDLPIGYADEDFHTQEQMEPYFKAWNRPEHFSAFSNKEGNFESTYIVVRPLLDSNGDTIALLCADMSLDEMHRAVNTYIFFSVLLIVLICVAFSLSVATWLSRSVSKPLAALEKSTRDFAEKSHGNMDISQLVYDAPDIHTENEIQSLSDAITQMSADMKGYVENILSAEKRAETAEEDVQGMTRIAYEDSLTHVKSKVAYDAKKAELAQKIADGKAKFAMVMIDLNNLKRMNDTYGLEKGDRYIVSCSELISLVYDEIPVYRIGGDEFVVILEDEAYHEREEMLAVLEEQFLEAAEDTKSEPWERSSAAVGMTEFSPDADQDVDQVYRRAEKIMLRNKRMMKQDLS